MYSDRGTGTTTYASLLLRTANSGTERLGEKTEVLDWLNEAGGFHPPTVWGTTHFADEWHEAHVKVIRWMGTRLAFLGGSTSFG